jgi:hypothetical protein
MQKLIAPLIHMNGDTRADLLVQHRLVLDAARDLMEVMRKARPHGRNYLPNGEHYDFTRARDAFNERYNAVNQIFEDFEEMTLEFLNQD